MDTRLCTCPDAPGWPREVCGSTTSRENQARDPTASAFGDGRETGDGRCKSLSEGGQSMSRHLASGPSSTPAPAWSMANQVRLAGPDEALVRTSRGLRPPLRALMGELALPSGEIAVSSPVVADKRGVADGRCRGASSSELGSGSLTRDIRQFLLPPSMSHLIIITSISIIPLTPAHPNLTHLPDLHLVSPSP